MKNRSFSSVVVLAVGVFMTAALWRTAEARDMVSIRVQGAGPLPDAPGKAEVERLCTTCHGLDFVAPSERTVPAWRQVLDLMKAYGAEATDEEWATVGGYIMRNLAFLSINQAPAADIGVVFGVSDKVAAGVVDYRDKSGGFKTADEVKKAPDVDAARVDELKPRLILESNK